MRLRATRNRVTGMGGKRSLFNDAIAAIRRNNGTLIGIPDNFAGAYIDRTGTQPVTAVGDLLGLITDRSYGAGNLGAEKVANGDFSAGTTGWAFPTGWALVSGAAAATSTNSSLRQSGAPLAAGKSYQVGFDWTHASGTLYVRVGAGTAVTHTTSGRKSMVLVAANTAGIEFYGGAVSGSLDNIANQEVLGNHATQPTTASKPTVTRVPKRTRGPVNLLTQSDFANGVTDAPSRGGLVTASTLAGYGGALAFGHDGSTLSYAYKAFTYTSGSAYTMACVVKMDDGLAPMFLSPTPGDATNTFALNMGNVVPNPSGYGVTSLGDGLYLVTASAVATAAQTFTGIVKYVSNNNRTFKVTRYGLFSGTYTSQQIIDNGGIPLTTTQPLPNVLEWTNAISFDGSNDFLQTGITTGNEGWVCAAVNVTDSNSTFFCSGAGSNGQKGIWMYRNASDDRLNFLVGDGTLVSNTPIPAPVIPANTPVVVDAGWTDVWQMIALNGAEVSKVRTNGSASPPPKPLRIGAYTDGTTYPMNGNGTYFIHCTSVPSAADRALIRKWLGSLQGQTL